MADAQAQSRTISRRALVAGAVVVGGGVLARTFMKNDPEGADNSARVSAAPMPLPPVAERLPREPLVVDMGAVGKHGGTMRRYFRSGSEPTSVLRIVGNQGLTRWNMAFDGVLPNVASRWEVTPDARTYVFFLRSGMRWSDGAPFTADDIVFAVEEVIKNKAIYGAVPSAYAAAGKPCTAEKVDDTTVKFTFESPNGLFLEQLAQPLGEHATIFPKHYAGRFHIAHNPRADAEAKDAGLVGWADLFRSKMGDIETATRWGNADKPTIDPWILEEPLRGGSSRVVLTRNPYFWQVDRAGQQLPYINKINMMIAQEPESVMLNVVAGRVDFQDRPVDSIQNKPVLSQNRRKGNYRLINMISAQAQMCQIYLNQTHKDPAMRRMFAARPFREALSLAIDRQAIIDLVYLGQSQPFQTGPRPAHPWYSEGLSKQYTRFDPTRSRALLDSIGYKADSSGVRRRPDGAAVFFTIDVIPTLYPDQVDALELIKANWADIGVDMKINTVERSLFFSRGDGNDHDAAIFISPGAFDPMGDPRDLFASHTQGSRYAIPWARWFASGGKSGEEPPESQKQRQALYVQAKATIDPERRKALMTQLFGLTAEAFETIGVCLGVNTFGVCSNRLRNVPDQMPQGWAWATPGPSMPQHYYFADV